MNCLTPAKEIYMMMGVNAAIEVRVAFSTRRTVLLANWMEAQGSPELMRFWAQSLQDANDAQLALGLGEL